MMELSDLIEAYLDARETLKWEREKSSPSQRGLEDAMRELQRTKAAIDEWSREHGAA